MIQNKSLFAIHDFLNSRDKKSFSKILNRYPDADIADDLELISLDDVTFLLDSCQPNEIVELFPYLSEEIQDHLIDSFAPDKIATIFAELPHDVRADLYNRLDLNKRKELMLSLDKEEQDDIRKLAGYAEGTAGAATTSDFVAIDKDQTAAEALAELRHTATEKETIYTIYVLDKQRHLLGTLSLRELIFANPNSPISSIMRPNPIFVYAKSPKKEAAALISRHNLLAIPVINGSNKMIGIITVDDAMDIEKDIDTAQMTRFGGGPDLDLRTSSVKQMFSVRAFWLIILTIFGTVTSTFVAAQQEMLEHALILAAFIAPIIDMGGNTGSQSATLVIRAMALGEVKLCWQDIWFTIKREFLVVLTLGIVIATLEVILAYFTKGEHAYGAILLVVGITMMLCTILGGIIGAMLPFAARAIGTDPATLSSPLITSIMDLLGVLIYFSLAYIFVFQELQI